MFQNLKDVNTGFSLFVLVSFVHYLLFRSLLPSLSSTHSLLSFLILLASFICKKYSITIFISIYLSWCNLFSYIDLYVAVDGVTLRVLLREMQGSNLVTEINYPDRFTVVIHSPSGKIWGNISNEVMTDSFRILSNSSWSNHSIGRHYIIQNIESFI